MDKQNRQKGDCLLHLHLRNSSKRPTFPSIIKSPSLFIFLSLFVVLSGVIVVSQAIPANNLAKDEVYVEDDKKQPDISTLDEIVSTSATDSDETTPNDEVDTTTILTTSATSTTSNPSHLVKRQSSKPRVRLTTSATPKPATLNENAKKTVIKDDVNGLRPVIFTKSPQPITVTNEVYQDPTEDIQFLCHHYHQDEFVVAAHVQEQGCRLECVFLKSSGSHGDSVLDVSETKVHNVNEGQSCDPEMDSYKCINGSCIEPPEIGKAVVTIINGTFESMDVDSPSDPYVKVFLDQKYLFKTPNVENNNNPSWGISFVTPLITSDTQIGFVVFDREPSGENLILTVQTTVDFTLKMGLNGTATCGPVGSPRGRLCYSIRWNPQQLQDV